MVGASACAFLCINGVVVVAALLVCGSVQSWLAGIARGITQNARQCRSADEGQCRMKQNDHVFRSADEGLMITFLGQRSKVMMISAVWGRFAQAGRSPVDMLNRQRGIMQE